MSTAFVDESRKEFASRAVYILGAVIISHETELARARQAMSLLLIPGEPKVHWYRAVDAYRRDIMTTLAGLDAMFLTVWHEILEGEADERCRRTCLALLSFELQQLGVSSVVLESRQPRLDRRDLDIFRSGPRVVGAPRPRATHVLGHDEPALWIADALCGAEGDRLAFNDHTFVSMLAENHYSISTRNAGRP